MERKGFYDGIKTDFLPKSIDNILTYNYEIDRHYFKKDIFFCRELFYQLTDFIRREIDAYYYPPIVDIKQSECVNITGSGFLFLCTFLYQRIRIASLSTSPKFRMDVTPFGDVVMYIVTPMETWNRVLGKDIFMPKAVYLARLCNFGLIAEQEEMNMVIRMVMPHYTPESFKMYQSPPKISLELWMKKALFEIENKESSWNAT